MSPTFLALALALANWDPCPWHPLTGVERRDEEAVHFRGAARVVYVCALSDSLVSQT